MRTTVVFNARNRRRVVILGVFALLISMTTMSQRPLAQLKGKVSLELTIFKSKFIKGEFVYAEVKVKNLGNERLEIPSLHQLTGGLKLMGTDTNNKPLHHVGPIVHGPEVTATLPPQGELVQTVDLETDLGNDDNSRHPLKAFLPGNYRIWATLGDVQSNHISFEVISPSGRELRVHEELRSLYVNHRRDEETEFKRLIREYPQSVYLPNIYLVLLGSLHARSISTGESTELKRASLEFISNFPNSPFVETALRYFINGLEIDEGVTIHGRPTENQRKQVSEEFLKLKNRFPRTKAASRVEKMVNAYLKSE